MTKYDYKAKLISLLCAEYNCGPEAFFGEANTVTPAAINPGRRAYSPERYFFHMVTLGNNAVITADAAMHPFLTEYVKGKTGHWLFELPNLLPIEKELNRFGHTLSQSFHMFLPERRIEAGTELELKWYFDGDIHRFYGDGRFSNAICESFDPNRPDRMAVVAMDGDRIMGMAGCSEDAPGWMQIGVDVLPEYRSRGVGTALVNAVKNRIEDLGAVPFYGTSLSNYNSWNIALNCGFRPAWVEIGSAKLR